MSWRCIDIKTFASCNEKRSNWMDQHNVSLPITKQKDSSQLLKNVHLLNGHQHAFHNFFSTMLLFSSIILT